MEEDVSFLVDDRPGFGFRQRSFLLPDRRADQFFALGLFFPQIVFEFGGDRLQQQIDPGDDVAQVQATAKAMF